jgi:hypothetical protein
MTKAAEELVNMIMRAIADSEADPEDKHIYLQDRITEALTTAEQRGYERGQNAIVKIGSYYDIQDSDIGNGCDHGFKPASSCPNKGCEFAEVVRLYNSALAVSNAVTESTEESKVQKMHIANSEYQRGKRDGYVEGLLEALSAVLWHCRFNSLEGVSATTFRDALDDEIQARLKEAQG